MPRRGSLVPITLALLGFSGAATAIAACDATKDASPAAGDAGGDGTVAPKTSCPKDEPVDQSACDLPEGTTCDFGTCGTNLSRCTLGTWVHSGNPPPSPPCPSTPPAADSGCPACWPASKTCVYEPAVCLAGDASPQNTAVAGCVKEIWSLDFRPCVPKDAGADVQGDADADGD
jgi:hypothetical protein